MTYFASTKLKDENGNIVGVQYPLPTDGDSVYAKDIDLSRSVTTGWTGDVLDLFGDLTEGVTFAGTSNPKTLLIYFNRGIISSGIALGTSTGNFSNVKISVIASGQSTVILDNSADNTDKQVEVVSFRAKAFTAIYVEFYTADDITLTNIGITKLPIVKVDHNNEHQPVHVTSTDGNLRSGANTVFGDRLVGQRIPSLAAQFVYGIEEDTTDSGIVTTGTISFIDSMLALSTGIASDGSASIETKEYLRYIPGFEAQCFFTSVFTPGAANSVQRTGLFDSNDGFFIGYEGTDFTVTRRRDGVDYTTTIDVTNVFPDATFDPTLGNIYKISFGYLGFAPITFEVMDKENVWRILHKIEYPNTEVVTHIKNTYLPLRGEVTNSGNITDLSVYIGSVYMGIVDGSASARDVTARNFSHSEVDTITAGGYVVFVLRNKTTFQGITNRIRATLKYLSVACEGNKPVSFYLLKNQAFTNTPTWTDVDTNNSTCEFSLDATVAPTALELSSRTPISLGKSGNDFISLIDSADGIFPGDWYVIYASSTATSDTVTGIDWKEEF